MMPNLQWVYWLVGALFAVFALLSALDPENPKRWRNTLFWGLVATSFLVGHLLSDLSNGLLVLALALLAGLGGLGLGKPKTTTPEERGVLAGRWGNSLFGLALIVPAVTFALSLALVLPPLLTGRKLTIAGQPFLGAEQPTVVALIIGIVAATLIAMLWLRPKPITPLQEGRRLIDQIGWAVVLPQALAALGGVFAVAGVGKAVGALTSGWIPQDNGLIAVAAYTFGMAAFTIVMGNAFAAFPIMTAAIGLPLIVGRLHGDPVIMAAIGMLSGFCGTLLTPMAANFNVVPAQLLELPDRNSIFNGVIRAQAPTGLIMLLINTALMYALVYRF
jgi:uncharacterized membrane protein